VEWVRTLTARSMDGGKSIAMLGQGSFWLSPRKRCMHICVLRICTPSRGRQHKNSAQETRHIPVTPRRLRPCLDMSTFNGLPVAKGLAAPPTQITHDLCCPRGRIRDMVQPRNLTGRSTGKGGEGHYWAQRGRVRDGDGQG
jgi:hypothetical protein